MKPLFRFVFMGIFLATGITTVLCLRALFLPIYTVPSPRGIAAYKEWSQNPSEVNRQELALATAEWESANKKQRMVLMVDLGILAIVLLGIGREINRLHEPS